MYKPKGESMTDTATAPLLGDFEDANPYNANKDYLEDQGAPVPTANESLFFKPTKDEPTTSTQEPVVEPTATSEPTGNQDHNWEKRYVDAKKYIETSSKEIKDLKDQLAARGVDTFKAPKTQEEIDTFKTKNPEIYDIIESIAFNRASEEGADVKDKLSSIEAREHSLMVAQAKKELVEAHSDFAVVTNSDQFHQWAESQPDVIKDWIYNNPTDSSLAIRAIDLFKADVSNMGAVEESTSQGQGNDQLDASSLVSTRNTEGSISGGKKQWSIQEINKLTPAMYDKYEDEIDLAAREGRISR